jgi:single-stranded-DNA-specific exonuclease
MKKYLLRNPISNKSILKNHSSILNHLLFFRDIKDAGEAQRFIDPRYDEHLHDSFLMKDMDKSVERILKAISENEKISIYSDYDADGIPGAVILHDLFKKIGYTNFINYIPDRHIEGFGLNKQAVKKLSNQNVRLIITIDCGIADVDEVFFAKQCGIETIITDHHEPKESLPNAYSIIDPKQGDCPYPDKNLCGSGVIFKLIQGILSKKRFDIHDGWEKWLLDMVGIATLSDMVPLRGENRVLASFGLKVLRKSKRKGLGALFRKIRLNQSQITEEDVGFSISPRINAASRMGVANDAFLLFTTDDHIQAQILADRLDHINHERKGIVASMVKEAKKIYSSRYQNNNSGVIVIGNPNWRPSLVGLVANTLAEHYGNPFFIWGRDPNEGIKGSCRGGNVSLVELMQNTKADTFEKFGGHKKSGGFTVSKDAIYDLEERLNISLSNISSREIPSENNIIDMILNINDISPELFEDLSVLSPFGIENEKPIFLMQNCLVQNIKTFGKEKEHIELSVSKNPNNDIKAISFFKKASSFTKIPESGKYCDIVGSIEKNTFNNKNEIRIRITDIIDKNDCDMMVS